MQNYQALYRSNRPEVFDEILGQEHIVKILKHQIETDTVSHAYLFCGTRGTGKTTTARILAKAVNCTCEGGRPCGECETCRAIAAGNFIDVIEIDAASNNGVESVRELRESVNYPPSIGRRKVYIIDEVHMMSGSAFNALLKTLEEPPAHVMFILATTNPEKLPQTVLSRCLRLDFKRVSGDRIMQNMRRIAAAQNVEIEDAALTLLASNADGSVRYSLSLLEQCLSSGEPVLTRDMVLDFLGTVSEEFYIELTEKVLTHNLSDALLLLEQALQEGKDVKQMMKDWMAHYRSLLITKYVADPQDMLNLSAENINRLRKQAGRIELDELNRSIITLARTIQDARYSTQARILMELAIVTIASGLEYGASSDGGGVRKISAARPMESAARAVAEQPPRAQQDASRAARDLASQVPVAERGFPDELPVTPVSERSFPDEPKLSPASARPFPDEPSPQVESSITQEELDEIWNDVMDEAVQISPSYTMALSSTRLIGLNRKQFKIWVNSEFLKERIESDAKFMEDLLEKRTGKRLKMVCVTDSDNAEKKDERLSRIASQASEVLGVKVSIK